MRVSSVRCFFDKGEIIEIKIAALEFRDSRDFFGDLDESRHQSLIQIAHLSHGKHSIPIMVHWGWSRTLIFESERYYLLIQQLYIEYILRLRLYGDRE